MLPCYDRHVACCGVLFVTDARSGALDHVVAALSGDPPLPCPDHRASEGRTHAGGGSGIAIARLQSAANVPAIVAAVPGFAKITPSSRALVVELICNDPASGEPAYCQPLCNEPCRRACNTTGLVLYPAPRK